MPHGNGQATSKHAVCCCCCCCEQHKRTIRKKKVKLLHSIPSAAVANNMNTHTHTPYTPPKHVAQEHSFATCPPPPNHAAPL